jgi:tRNA threonylcarbamoyl adenosine modification protein YeaZ
LIAFFAVMLEDKSLILDKIAQFPVSSAYGLSLDTTSPTLGLAIATEKGDRRSDAWALGHGLSSQLQEVLQRFMVPQQWSELAWIAVMQGPGSFTGTRLGVVTARMLAQQLGIPLYGFSNLAIAAWMAVLETEADKTVAVTMSGQRGFVYGAIYRVNRGGWQLEAIAGDRLMEIEAWQSVVEGDSSVDVHIKQETQGTPNPQDACEAMLALSWHRWTQTQRPHWETVLPFYG